VDVDVMGLIVTSMGLQFPLTGFKAFMPAPA
jgi:small neutral amino acid transporter SnatA (MarC family)